MSDSATAWTIHSVEFSRSEYWSGSPFPSPGDLPNPDIEPRSPTLQAVSLPAEPQGKPKNTGVGSLSLLQWIFPTQESNWGLLHCRQILYQLKYQESPIDTTEGLRLLGPLCLSHRLLWLWLLYLLASLWLGPLWLHYIGSTQII